jgi:hypothetical protein
VHDGVWPTGRGGDGEAHRIDCRTCRLRAGSAVHVVRGGKALGAANVGTAKGGRLMVPVAALPGGDPGAMARGVGDVTRRGFGVPAGPGWVVPASVGCNGAGGGSPCHDSYSGLIDRHPADVVRTGSRRGYRIGGERWCPGVGRGHGVLIHCRVPLIAVPLPGGIKLSLGAAAGLCSSGWCWASWNAPARSRGDFRTRRT